MAEHRGFSTGRAVSEFLTLASKCSYVGFNFDMMSKIMVRSVLKF